MRGNGLRVTGYRTTLIKQFLAEFGIIGDGISILGVMICHFLPDFLAVQSRFVDARILRLDDGDHRRDDAEASALRLLLFGEDMRGLIVILTSGSDVVLPLLRVRNSRFPTLPDIDEINGAKITFAIAVNN